MFSISIEPWWRVLILSCFVFMLLCALFNNPAVKGNRGLFIVTKEVLSCLFLRKNSVTWVVKYVKIKLLKIVGDF